MGLSIREVVFRIGGCVGLWAAAALMPLVASGQETYYVDGAYEGPEEGTAVRPFSELGAALEAVQPGRGDTVLVESGTYQGAFAVPAETLLASLRGPMATALLRSAGGGAAVTLGDGAVVQGFRIGAASGTGVLLGAGNSGDVRNCVIHEGNTGVEVRGGATGRIDNNTFYNNETGLFVFGGAEIASLQNNIFSANGVGAEVTSGVPVNNGYNAFWQNGSAYVPAIPADTDLARQPLFVSATDNNFHLRSVSGLRNAGNPAPLFNNRDGSRNTIGADGGPNGTVDLLVPAIAVSTTPSPAQGAAPLSVLFNAGESSDAWGIEAWEWDFDGRGVSGFGPAAPFVFTQPGGYLVSLTVRDNSGLENHTRIPVRVGNAPSGAVTAQPPAGRAPVEVRYSFDAGGASILEQEWDVDGDGRIDSRAASPRITWDTDLDPGLYEGTLLVTDLLGRSSLLPLSFTLTDHDPDVIQTLQPGQATNMTLSIEGNPADGANFVLQSGSIGAGLTLTMTGLDPELLPIAPPGGTAVAALYVAPAGKRLARMAEVTLPLPDREEPEGLVVWWLNPSNNEWQTRGIGRVRVDLEGRPVVRFETARLGTFAVTMDTLSLPPACGCGAEGGSRGRGGDGLILSALLVALAIGTRFRPLREAAPGR